MMFGVCWRNSIFILFLGIPRRCDNRTTWSSPSSMEFHGIFLFCYLMEPLASWILWVLNFDRIPYNLSFQILMKIISTFAEWINFRKLVSTLYRFVSFSHQLMFYYQYLHYTIYISGITHYVSKYHSKSLFNAHCNLFWSKSSRELSPEFHGTFEQHLNNTCGSMEFRGT